VWHCGLYRARRGIPILIDALKKLEYRGMIRQAIAVWSDGKVEVARKKGKVDELRDLCAPGIRARWDSLTHAGPRTAPVGEECASHRAGDVVVVHNGIVENYI